MIMSKVTLLIILLNIGFTVQVITPCTSLFSTGNDTDLCYYYKKHSLTWTDAYNQCLTRTYDGILIQIFSKEQFNTLKNINIDGTSLFWIGANNFASFRDSNWYWLDGSIVDNKVITWCPDSTYLTAFGTQCAAYDSTLKCVNNYLCNTLLPAPCVSSKINGINKHAKINLIDRAITTSLCGSTSGGTYSNWWTYSIILINWFILFCFFLYLCNRFILNKSTIILILAIVIVSFILIIVYAILWGVQYQDFIQIPLAIVIIGCIATALLMIVLFIILNNRTRVQRYKACMVMTALTIIFEWFLMLGLILCIAYCSGFITLAWTSLEKDVTAALLASLTAAISILYYTGVLFLLENTGNDRIHVAKTVATNLPPPPRPTTQAVVAPPRPTVPAIPIKKVERAERATSPVDERILNEFYTDKPKDIHQYTLEGRQYVVYEGTNLTDIDTYRKELTQAMLLQEPEGLREAINRAKSSIHASTLAEEIRQAESLATKLV